MKKSYFLISLFCLFSGIIFFFACDSESPLSSSAKINPSGTWQFSGQIISNTCRFLYDDRQVGQTSTETLNILYNDIWRASHREGTIYPADTLFWGKIHPSQKALWFAIDYPKSLTYGQCPYQLQGEVYFFLDSETSGTGSLTVEVLAQHPACPSCALLHTGVWTKLSSDTIPISLPTPTPVIIYTPTPLPPPATPTPHPTPEPTETPEPTAIPPQPGTLLLSASPMILNDTSPDSTSNLTVCAFSASGVPQSGIRIFLQITSGNGLLWSGTLADTVVTNITGCAANIFTEQGVSNTTISVTSSGYTPKSVTIQVLP